MKMQMEELKEALRFVCSLEFWTMALFWTIALLLSYLQLLKRRIFGPRSSSSSFCIRSPTGSQRPICVITGATSGLGKATACALSREGFYIILVGRSSHSLSETLNGIKNQNKEAYLKAFEVDMSSFQSILKFRNSLQQWLSDSDLHPSIQLLVNNAGILATSNRLTTEGYDDAADPGSVKTNIMREVPLYLSLLAFFSLKLLGLLQSPEDGIKSIIDAALAPPEVSGRYFFGGNGRTIESSAISRDPKLAKELWDTSCDILGESQATGSKGNKHVVEDESLS